MDYNNVIEVFCFDRLKVVRPENVPELELIFPIRKWMKAPRPITDRILRLDFPIFLLEYIHFNIKNTILIYRNNKKQLERNTLNPLIPIDININLNKTFECGLIEIYERR